MEKTFYEVAREIQARKLSREEAITEFGPVIDRETLVEALNCLRPGEDVDGERTVMTTRAQLAQDLKMRAEGLIKLTIWATPEQEGKILEIMSNPPKPCNKGD